MKVVLVGVLFFSISALAQNPNRQNKAPFGSPSNATSESRGSSNSGLSDGALGLDEREKKQARQRARSMGGAPNMGAGMGTGTGAGSTIGPDIEIDEEEDRTNQGSRNGH